MRNIQAVGDRPYITTAKVLVGWVQRVGIFVDVQHCIHADTCTEVYFTSFLSVGFPTMAVIGKETVKTHLFEVGGWVQKMS